VTFSPVLDATLGLEDGSDDFYLGVATGGTLPQQGLGRTTFGWLKLKLVIPPFGAPPRLEYLDSAVSYGRGIIIGTSMTVPEPSALTLGLVGLILAVRKSRLRYGGVAEHLPR
jgi:hypothetical protein